MSSSHRNLLRHISDEIEFLLKEAEKTTGDTFMRDDVLQRAFVRSFEIIGEASKVVPQELKQEHPHIEWKSMARMRDRLIHHYFGVDYALVWDTVKTDIPQLKRHIDEILNSG